MINSVLLLNLSELLISTVFVWMASKLLLKFKTRRARVLVISHIIGRDDILQNLSQMTVALIKRRVSLRLHKTYFLFDLHI